MAKTVVILGGAYAGVQVAHRLLKHTRSSVPDLKVILVSKVRRGFRLTLLSAYFCESRCV